MVEIVSDETIAKLIACLHDQHNPAHAYEAKKALVRWLKEPLFELTQAQRDCIESALGEGVNEQK